MEDNTEKDLLGIIVMDESLFSKAEIIAKIKALPPVKMRSRYITPDRSNPQKMFETTNNEIRFWPINK